MVTINDTMGNQYEDDQDAVMISALEHYSYCPRQCALIHLEQIFDENMYTMRGHIAHERVDQMMSRTEDTIKVERGLALWSKRLGLVGRADVVEFHGPIPYPVEYKVGKRRKWHYEVIQVCAQALCLEEMFGAPVKQGAIYYCETHNRREIDFTQELRDAVAEITASVRIMLQSSNLPPGVYDARCKNCSLQPSCLPNVIAKPEHLRTYRNMLFTVEKDSKEV